MKEIEELIGDTGAAAKAKLEEYKEEYLAIKINRQIHRNRLDALKFTK
jgi:hypothetical protein